MNKIAVAQELVKIAKSIMAGYDKVIEGEQMRLSYGYQGYRLQELPYKGAKKLKVVTGSWAPWLSRSQSDEFRYLNIENAIKDVHSSMSYDQAKKTIEKNMQEFAEEAVEKTKALGEQLNGREYKVEDLIHGPYENEVHYLQVEPYNTKPITVKGKDFTMDVAWAKFQTYSPSSDFQQADPHYSLLVSTSASSARKLYKMASANPDLLKSVAWSNHLLGWIRTVLETTRIIVSGRGASMNKEIIAKELVSIAKELTAATSISSRVRNAEAMIKSGGRGIELGIREIDYLSRDMAELHKQMRIIQNSSRMGYIGESTMQEELLGQLENRK